MSFTEQAKKYQLIESATRFPTNRGILALLGVSIVPATVGMFSAKFISHPTFRVAVGVGSAYWMVGTGFLSTVIPLSHN